MRVIFAPVARNNPYQYLLADKLKGIGLHVEFLSKLPKEHWYFLNAKKTIILHIHWISPLYRWKWKTPIRFARFIAKLTIAKLLGYKIVWTVHNIMPHEKKNLFFDFFGRIFMAVIADDIILHCIYARDEFSRRFFRKRNLHIIPHGNYLNCYKPQIKKKKAREKLNINADAFVYLFFGNIKFYKGIQDLISTFKKIEDPYATLVIAGQCDPGEETTLYKMSQNDKRIHLSVGFVENNDVNKYLSAADVLVVPFKEVLNSGSVILAISYGLPVIAPAIGCLPEIIKSNAGILYEVNGENELLNAMESIQNYDLKSMVTEAKRTAISLNWEEISEKTYQIYRSYF